MAAKRQLQVRTSRAHRRSLVVIAPGATTTDADEETRLSGLTSAEVGDYVERCTCDRRNYPWNDGGAPFVDQRWDDQRPRMDCIGCSTVGRPDDCEGTLCGRGAITALNKFKNKRWINGLRKYPVRPMFAIDY
jgi:hypothetical protein